MGKRNRQEPEFSQIHYVKLVSVGSLNPNAALTLEAKEEQANLLNRCLNDYPRGRIIGKDTGIGRFMIGEHELIMEQVTYHVGFVRKPEWLSQKASDERGIGI